jgi:hypothetical protein
MTSSMHHRHGRAVAAAALVRLVAVLAVVLAVGGGLGGVLGLGGASGGVAGAAIVPPQEPGANISPPPGYSGPCGSASEPAPSCPSGLATIDGDRQAEGVAPMSLPTDYATLTPAEQVFVLTNLERVDRGLPPVEGLAASLDGLAQAGADSGRDPSGPAYGSSWASTYAGTPSVVEADTLWMYQDGFGGPNVDCTSPTAAGCWAHRAIILGSYAAPLLMGAGSGSGTTQLFVGGDTTDSPYVTWSDVTPNLPVGVYPAAPAISALPGSSVSSAVELWASGENMNVSLSLSGGQGVFHLESGGCDLAAGTSCNATIGFTPPSVGVYTATLLVSGPNGTQDVTVRGISSHGYQLAAADGGVFSFGDAVFYGSTGALHLNRPVVGMAATPDHGGYWLVASDGGIFAFGDAHFYGSMGGRPLDAPIVGMAATPDGKGYWEVASDGGVFSFGDAAFYGSRGGQPLNRPVVGMASSPTGHGYWLVASDGGVFTYGDATFHGSAGALALNAPVVGMAATNGGGGYWLAAADGGIFAYGDAPFFGSAGGLPLNAPVVGMAPTIDGGGYWLAAADGGIFNYGDAAFFGSMGGTRLNAPVVGAAAAG